VLGSGDEDSFKALDRWPRRPESQLVQNARQRSGVRVTLSEIFSPDLHNPLSLEHGMRV
jgi:hypothetical protein